MRAKSDLTLFQSQICLLLSALLYFPLSLSAADLKTSNYPVSSNLFEKRQWAWKHLDQILSEPTVLFSPDQAAQIFSKSYPNFSEAERNGKTIVDPKNFTAFDAPPVALPELKSLRRTLYSRQAVETVLSHFHPLTDCLKFFAVSATERAYCLGKEFSHGSFLIKLVWSRVKLNEGLRVANTSNDALKQLPGKDFEWSDFSRTSAQSPLTVRLGPSETYALVGVHVMSKLTPDWVWMSAWWSPDDSSNFAEDRPQQLLSHWLRQAKICIVDSHFNGPLGEHPSFGSLNEALRITDNFNLGHSWCSNPLIENGKGNARSNCIGCHQYAGTEINPGNILKESLANPLRLVGQHNTKIPLDYSWSLIQGEKALGLEILDWREYFETDWKLRRWISKNPLFKIPDSPASDTLQNPLPEWH